eukprot:6087472-Amphidinium_carterae.1
MEILTGAHRTQLTPSAGQTSIGSLDNCAACSRLVLRLDGPQLVMEMSVNVLHARLPHFTPRSPLPPNGSEVSSSACSCRTVATNCIMSSLSAGPRSCIMPCAGMGRGQPQEQHKVLSE